MPYAAPFGHGRHPKARIATVRLTPLERRTPICATHRIANIFSPTFFCENESFDVVWLACYVHRDLKKLLPCQLPPSRTELLFGRISRAGVTEKKKD
eukprot:scaffold3255_cov158-Amphora_coffeaeformis.AAC.2